MSAVVRGILFTGFTVQILFGLIWMYLNFGYVQDFREAESVLYGGILNLAGGIPQIMYLIQTAFALWAGYYFLEKLQPSDRSISGKCRAVWRVLVLTSCPFALQCHLALLPFSFMNSLFLLLLSFILQAAVRKKPVPDGPGRKECASGELGKPGRKEPASDELGELEKSSKKEPASDEPGELEKSGKKECASDGPGELGKSGRKECASDEPGELGKSGRKGLASDRPGKLERKASAGRHRCVPVLLTLAVLCGGLAAALSGVADSANREKLGSSIEAAMASRFAWPTIWVDCSNWTEELQEITRDVAWEASFAPGNMELIEKAIEENTAPETAKSYYMQIAEVGWKFHAPMVIRQIGWDILGYTVTPVIMQLQLRGEAYDSYTGRNYEIMGGKAPVLTRNYVDYYSWWFVVSLLLTFVSVVLELFQGEKIRWRNVVASVLICLFFSGILAGVLALRGAGIMDYKYTVVVNQLWLIPALMLIWRNPKGLQTKAGSGEDAV